MNRITLIVLLTVVSGAASAAELPGFTSIFNGKDLTGWVDVNTSPETWVVENGLLPFDPR